MICSFSFFINNQNAMVDLVYFFAGKSPQNVLSEDVQASNNNVKTLDYDFSNDVPETTPVSNDFFNNTLFVGDSLTLGIKQNNTFPNNNILAYNGIDPESAMTLKVINTPKGDFLTIIDSMKEHDPDQIYIMMGANGIGYMTTDSLLKSYEKFVDEVINQHPDSKIFIESILPVTSEFEEQNPSHNNKKIDQMNDLLRNMCKQKQLYFLDISSVYKDENGALYEYISPDDGLHITAQSYKLWEDYLLTHTVI